MADFLEKEIRAMNTITVKTYGCIQLTTFG